MKSMDIQFRPAAPDELPLVLSFLKEAAVWLREKEIDYWQSWHAPPSQHINWLQEGFDRGEFFIIEAEGNIIGCFRLQWEDPLFWGYRDDTAGYLHSLAISRNLSGRGIGQVVFRLIEEHCQNEGKQFLRLDCGTHIDGLRRYYESLGFQPVGETTVRGELLILYEKSLS